MASKALPVFQFYDIKSKRRRCELEKVVDKYVKKFRQEKLPEEFKQRITGPSTEWKTFFRQQDAFDYVRSKTHDALHVFAFESGSASENQGKRLYLAASYPVFWHYYSQLPADMRHHYEVIPEGAVCKLYFDLEYSKKLNWRHDGPKMVDIFIKYVSLWLSKKYKIDCSRQNVFDLDASTSDKFSRHLIFQLPNVAFRNNIQAGQLIHFIFDKLLARVAAMDKTRGDNLATTGILGSCRDQESSPASETKSLQSSRELKLDTGDKPDKNDSGFESPEKGYRLVEDSSLSDIKADTSAEEIFSQFTLEELQSLVVQAKDEKRVLFCDMGVYTKNRNFRLFMSTKLGKQNPFKLSPDNLYQPQNTHNKLDGFSLFLDSLISNVEYTECMRILTFGSDEPGKILPTSLANTGQSRGCERQSDTLEGFTKSPYPELDEFIYHTVSKNDRNGYIRHWTYFTEGELLIYDIARYRWCENIQRQHRSNNIMYCVDMKKGVYYQKCHDPDCKAVNFKSDDCVLPQHVLPGYYFERSDDSDDDVVLAAAEAERMIQMEDESDEELLSAALKMEKQ